MRTQNQNPSVSVSVFDQIAAEYYDSGRHPTCANFRFASSLWLTQQLKCYRGEQLCEVGCGKSLVAEILCHQNSSLRNVVLTDDSAVMLEYSRTWEACGVQLKVASADALPIQSGALQYLISCLGDPYNTGDFWREVARVLEIGGRGFYTTPANDWARSFRKGEVPNAAEFELASGLRVSMPSCIYSEADQILLIEDAGLRVEDVSNVTVGDLASQHLSRKLLIGRGSEASVVTGFAVVRS
jgi:hypothetical protein